MTHMYGTPSSFVDILTLVDVLDDVFYYTLSLGHISTLIWALDAILQQKPFVRRRSTNAFCRTASQSLLLKYMIYVVGPILSSSYV